MLVLLNWSLKTELTHRNSFLFFELLRPQDQNLKENAAAL